MARHLFPTFDPTQPGLARFMIVHQPIAPPTLQTSAGSRVSSVELLYTYRGTRLAIGNNIPSSAVFVQSNDFNPVSVFPCPETDSIRFSLLHVSMRRASPLRKSSQNSKASVCALRHQSKTWSNATKMHAIFCSSPKELTTSGSTSRGP